MTSLHHLLELRAFRILLKAAIVLWIGHALCLNEVYASDHLEKTAPFYPGERLVFELKWGVIPAGEAVLEVRPTVAIDGVESHHFVLTAKTNEFVDYIYKVRQRIDAYADFAACHSLLYTDVHTHRKKKKEVTVTFDWNESKAHYAASGKEREPIAVQPGTFDPLSIFYYARHFHLEEGAVFKRPVTDGKKCVIGHAKVFGKETIDTAMGTFDTYLIEPDLKDVGGVFKKSPDAKISLWVTADSRRIPVKLKSKVVIGSFTGELIAIE